MIKRSAEGRRPGQLSEHLLTCGRGNWPNGEKSFYRTCPDEWLV